MKKLYTLLMLIFLIFISSCSSNNIEDNEYNTLSTSYIANPDQGFYRPVYINLKKQTNITSYLNYDSQLFHLRIDISNYSSAYNKQSDIEFSDNDLKYLDNILNSFYNKEKNVIIRFSYDPYFEGKSNMEASLDTMVSHIKSACAIFNKYPSTITAIEVGMVGPWGEMHTSKCATTTTINTLIDTYLNNTTDISILVRTPKMIYDYLGITINDIKNYKIDDSSNAYRLSLFNDGYLGSDTDLGTYTSRELETAWLSNLTNHNPYGGEVTSPTSTIHNIENCLDEMNLMNLSYLNIEWNDKVISKWKSTYYSGSDEFNGTTAFDYINSHLGYRFNLIESHISYDDNKLNISIKINNTGFGNLNKDKYLYIYIVDSNNETYEYDLGIKTKELDNLSLKVDTNIKGKIYLGIKDKNKKYAIKFANKDVYNEEIKANYIGSIN